MLWMILVVIGGVEVANAKSKAKPKPDGETDWNNTGTDWNTGASWNAVSGTTPPSSIDVAWFKTAEVTNPNLSASASIAGLYFNGTGAKGYDITSSSTSIKLTLTGTSNNSGTAPAETSDTSANAIRAENTSGTNIIDAPIVLGAAAGVTQYFYQARGGTLVLNGVISSTNAIGGLTLRSAGAGTTSTFTLGGANTYAGPTTLNDDNITLNINNATAISSGVLITSGNVTIDNTSGSAITLTNNNPLTLGGGTTNFTFTGSNDLNFGTGAVSLIGGNRTITVNAGTLTFGGSVNDNGQNNTLTKAGSGTLTLNGTAGTYTGKTIIQGGTLSINSIKNVGVSSSIGAPTTVSNGTIDIGSSTTSATLKYTGTGDTTNRVINMNGTTGGVTLDQSGTGLLKFTSDFTAVAGGSKILTLQGSTAGTGEISGAVVDNSGSNKTSILKQGTGAWTLSGANTYTGTTTVSGGTLKLDNNNSTTARLATSNITINSSGTFLLTQSGVTASNDRINNSATITLNGGTFATGGLSEHGATNNTAGIGALTLQSTSIIDMGAGSSIVAFADSHLASWAGTLSIYNWSGTPVTGGGTDQLYFGNSSSGLTSGQLSEVAFYSDNGITALGVAQILANGEIVPIAVPEPGTWFAGTLAVLGLSYSQRKRFATLLRRAQS